MRRSIVALAVVVTLAVASTSCTSAPQISEVTASTPAPSTTAAGASSTTSPGNAASPEDESNDAHSTPKNEPDRQKGADDKELSADDVVRLAITDIEKYWAAEMPTAYNMEYEPVSGGFHPYSSEKAPPKCGTIQPTYRDLAGNAFYCDRSDLVAWDAEGLIPKLNDQFGSFAVALVLAHEWGHAVQSRIKVLHKVDTIRTEQQADCFAGSWTRHVADGKSETLDLLPGALEGGIAALIELRDPPGEIDAKIEGEAHGNAFDRVNAFQTGYDGGSTACTKLIEEPLDLTEVRFKASERATGGNLAPDLLLDVVPRLLNSYWVQGAEATGLKFAPITDVKGYDPGESVACNGKDLSAEAIVNEIFVCVPDAYVAFDKRLTEGVYENIGDWAVATLLAKQWVAAIQAQNDIDDSTRVALLEGACFTGSFSKEIVDGVEVEIQGESQVFSLSPGDLDEAVITFLTFSDSPADDNTNAVTAFDKVRVFRSGFFGGPQACLQISGQENGAPGGGAPADGASPGN